MPVPIDTPKAVKDQVARNAIANSQSYIVFYYDEKRGNGRSAPMPVLNFQQRGHFTPEMWYAIQAELEHLISFVQTDSDSSLRLRGCE